jgi:hypothetical protein
MSIMGPLFRFKQIHEHTPIVGRTSVGYVRKSSRNSELLPVRGYFHKAPASQPFQSRPSATNGCGPWWNGGASHRNAAYPKPWFDHMGLVTLLETQSRFSSAS